MPELLPYEFLPIAILSAIVGLAGTFGIWRQRRARRRRQPDLPFER